MDTSACQTDKRWWVSRTFWRGGSSMEKLLTIGCIPFVLLLFSHLRAIARRARSAQLMEYCYIVALGTSAALVYVASALWNTNKAHDGFPDFQQWLLDVSLPFFVIVTAILLPLFVLWSLYLLTAFCYLIPTCRKNNAGESWTRERPPCPNQNEPQSPRPISTPDCFRCGYDLRGIADDHACPECGLLAGRRRRATDELHATRPKWLRKVFHGASISSSSRFPVAIIWPFFCGLLVR